MSAGLLWIPNLKYEKYSKVGNCFLFGVVQDQPCDWIRGTEELPCAGGCCARRCRSSRATYGTCGVALFRGRSCGVRCCNLPEGLWPLSQKSERNHTAENLEPWNLLLGCKAGLIDAWDVPEIFLPSSLVVVRTYSLQLHSQRLQTPHLPRAVQPHLNLWNG